MRFLHMNFSLIKNCLIALFGISILEVLKFIEVHQNVLVTIIQILIGLATLFYILVKARKTWHETPINKK